MELRDQFAIAILPAIYRDTCIEWREIGTGPVDEHWRDGLALEAYWKTDEMLKMHDYKFIKQNQNEETT